MANKIDWNGLDKNYGVSPPDTLVESGTEALLAHVANNEKNSDSDPSVVNQVNSDLTNIFQANTKEKVKIAIDRSLYNRIVNAKHKYKSGISVPAFIQKVVDELLKANGL